MKQDQLMRAYRAMLLARHFEQRAAQAYAAGKIGGFLHLYPGEEAVAVGVLQAAEPADYVVTTYREHVHALVRGIPAGQIMAELYGRRDGICGGMGGSMHLFDRERRFMGGYAIVGETFPIAIGIAYGIVLRKLPEAVICFFGEGAVNQGTFHESLNMAALWRLPVLFVCENNRYQIGTHIDRHSAVTDVYKRASAYNMPAEQVDGMDVQAVHAAAHRMLQNVRAGSGPQFLDLPTYRFRGHSMADAGAYRPKAEVDAFKETGPLRRIESQVDGAAREAIELEVKEIIEQAILFAEASPEPSWQDAWHALKPNRKPEILIREEN
ncbi:MAG: pyruvate dehydrogenase (acetyl-transferring) E1 component subunit alpha [Chthoniobacter sp.]|nr:pyruvate dehydrogenase (acetyl-transferring) E1 component subunit alpha [Chthoniobacter sp.]